MKLIMILAASLLPFLHETRYPAEVKGCDAQGITLSAEGELFHAELFNVTYAEEDGWQDACAILAEADEVSFEVDPLVSLEEPLPVYLFADGQMVQERLLQEGKAVLSIRNPNYAMKSSWKQLSRRCRRWRIRSLRRMTDRFRCARISSMRPCCSSGQPCSGSWSGNIVSAADKCVAVHARQ